MRIGIIGAGQLGRMLALAGYPLGSRFHFLDRSAEAPGAQVGEIVLGAFDDPQRLAELAQQVELITFDVENVPADLLNEIAAQRPFLPPVNALATAQDRLAEKQLFDSLGIATPQWHAVDSLAELETGIGAIGLPAVLKTRRLGYDGRGQMVLREPADIQTAWEKLGSWPLILEQFMPFEREVSIIGARSTGGETVYYPLSENTHQDGILHYCTAPYIDQAMQATAESYLAQLFEKFDYAGVLTIEFFVVDGQLVANEIAPRVHNSGHWTIEGARTSQFENHIRAIRGLPLGSTTPIGHSAMVNFIGQLPPLETVLAIRGAKYHDYGKSPRPLRKLGHCTITTSDAGDRDSSLQRLLQLVHAGS
ncbi:MAG: 5-(carboxyamino)imidazole ribonucleotide synthase [Gammaproteobacteria bacterium]|nr:5-(carboxyamino)imidazole ribonucleotide synthase [Gammaproteobacteria bacterium]NND59217.1 5-(carboxyamino)imidazole ribonucleotide synthase [Gammaproteobacteria bacterium]